MSNIGILGGSFDPFHRGHLSIALAAASLDSFKEVVLMPAKVSPFKVGREMASDHDRVRMLELVAEEYDKITVSTYEIEHTEVSYTFDTLTALQELYPDDSLWFIVGSDSLLSLEEWHKGKELLSHFSFLLAPRPGYDLYETDQKMQDYINRYGTQILVLDNEHFDISSTEIKITLRQGKPITDMVPEAVERYIHEQGLYL